MTKKSNTTKYQDKVKRHKEILGMGAEKKLWIKELYNFI